MSGEASAALCTRNLLREPRNQLDDLGVLVHALSECQLEASKFSAPAGYATLSAEQRRVGDASPTSAKIAMRRYLCVFGCAKLLQLSTLAAVDMVTTAGLACRQRNNTNRCRLPVTLANIGPQQLGHEGKGTVLIRTTKEHQLALAAQHLRWQERIDVLKISPAALTAGDISPFGALGLASEPVQGQIRPDASADVFEKGEKRRRALPNTEIEALLQRPVVDRGRRAALDRGIARGIEVIEALGPAILFCLPAARTYRPLRRARLLRGRAYPGS